MRYWSRRDVVATTDGSPTGLAAWVVLVVSGLTLLVVSWYPFVLQSPYVDRRPESSTDAMGAVVSFDGTDLLHSDGEPIWLGDARRSGRLTVALVASTDHPHQSGPARLFTLGEDISEANLTFGHEGDDLLIRLRRPGADAVGEPAYMLRDFFSAGSRRSAELQVDGDRVVVLSDGAVVVDETVGAPVLAGWAGGYSLSVGDEPAGERGWVGRLEELEVSTGSTTTDLLAEGALEPGGERELRPRMREITTLAMSDPLLLTLVRTLVLVPFGAAIYTLSSRAHRRRRLLLLAGLALPLVLMAGKVVIADRHPSPVNTAFEQVGAVAGYGLAARYASSRERAR
jgi:hypothetical protein